MSAPPRAEHWCYGGAVFGIGPVISCATHIARGPRPHPKCARCYLRFSLNRASVDATYETLAAPRARMRAAAGLQNWGRVPNIPKAGLIARAAPPAPRARPAKARRACAAESPHATLLTFDGRQRRVDHTHAAITNVRVFIKVDGWEVKYSGLGEDYLGFESRRGRNSVRLHRKTRLSGPRAVGNRSTHGAIDGAPLP